MKKVLQILCAVFLFVSAPAWTVEKKDIEGYWFTHSDDGKVSVARMFEYENTFYAYSFVFEDKKPSKVLDVHNPKPELRKRPVRGLVYVYDLIFNGKGWGKGEIYRPSDGKTFHLKAVMPDQDTIIFTASIDKAGMFGKKLKWTRVPNVEEYKEFDVNLNDVIKNLPKSSL